jgi:2-keto-3-deoxy-L-rhamnonate aldolase RhmA
MVSLEKAQEAAVNASFRKKLSQKELLIGTLLTLPSPEVAEILMEAGFDWIFIDAEHGTHSLQDVQRILQAAQSRCPCVVRVPLKDEIWIKRILDTGPAGILVPHVNSAQDALDIMQMCLYPPQGKRSAGISRAQGYGMKSQEYMKNANREVVVVLQVEHIDGVRNIESIVAVPGAAAVFVGPYDLSGSMDKLGDVADPEVMECIEKVKTACDRSGLPAGIFGVDAEAVKPYIELGYTLIAVGSDTLFLGKEAQQTLRLLR